MGAGHGRFANTDQQLGRHGCFRGQQTGHQQFMTGKQREADARGRQPQGPALLLAGQGQQKHRRGSAQQQCAGKPFRAFDPSFHAGGQSQGHQPCPAQADHQCRDAVGRHGQQMGIHAQPERAAREHQSDQGIDGSQQPGGLLAGLVRVLSGQHGVVAVVGRNPDADQQHQKEGHRHPGGQRSLPAVVAGLRRQHDAAQNGGHRQPGLGHEHHQRACCDVGMRHGGQPGGGLRQ